MLFVVLSLLSLFGVKVEVSTSYHINSTTTKFHNVINSLVYHVVFHKELHHLEVLTENFSVTSNLVSKNPNLLLIYVNTFMSKLGI